MKQLGKKEWLRYNHAARAEYAENLVEEVFRNAGWKVIKNPRDNRAAQVDLVIERQQLAYAVEVKLAPEGRSDRLVPIWSQAYLQGKHAGSGRNLLVIVVAPRIHSRAVEQLLEFAEECASDAAVGIIDFEGLQVFRGPHLDDLNSNKQISFHEFRRPKPKPVNLFSDLNQWMLKVLLAPSVPNNLLAAPRSQYENASQLAGSANVSVMSAFRFIEQLKQDGYLDQSSRHLNLVRRRELFVQWQSASSKPAKEIRVKYIFRVDPKIEMKRILNANERCLALFGAAEELGFGFVHGVPPYVYVRRINEDLFGSIGSIREAAQNESPDLIFREPKVPESVFRGMVKVSGQSVSDIFQIWLDVSSHPSRGIEQARFIEDRIIKSISLEQ